MNIEIARKGVYRGYTFVVKNTRRKAFILFLEIQVDLPLGIADM